MFYTAMFSITKSHSKIEDINLNSFSPKYLGRYDMRIGSGKWLKGDVVICVYYVSTNRRI